MIASGLISQQVGASFEMWLDGQHVFAKRAGIIAHIIHNQVATNVIQKRLIRTAASVADYTATLEGGMSLAVEAKSTQEKTLKRSAVQPLQQQHLDAVARAGGLALLVIEFRDDRYDASRSSSARRRYAIPWLAVPWVTKRTAESVDESSLQQWLIAPQTCYLSRYHPGGPQSSRHSQRVYPRE